jgi:hypothetical protein
MEKSEQRVVIKFLWMKGFEANCIRTILSRVLGDDCYLPRRLNVGLPAFEMAVFHVPIMFDHVAQ